MRAMPKVLPTAAGVSQIQWGDKYFNHYYNPPRQDGNTIVLPPHPDEFISLAGGNQFLVRYQYDFEHQDGFTAHGYYTYWGGTDEGVAFFTFLEDSDPFQRPPYYQAYTEGGEVAFYASLKPSDMSELEKHYQAKSIRRGGLYALSLPFTVHSLDAIATFLHAGYSFTSQDVSNYLFSDAILWRLDGQFVGQRVHPYRNWQNLTYTGCGILLQGKLQHPQLGILQLENLHLICMGRGIH